MRININIIVSGEKHLVAVNPLMSGGNKKVTGLFKYVWPLGIKMVMEEYHSKAITSDQMMNLATCWIAISSSIFILHKWI